MPEITSVSAVQLAIPAIAPPPVGNADLFQLALAAANAPQPAQAPLPDPVETLPDDSAERQDLAASGNPLPDQRDDGGDDDTPDPALLAWLVPASATPLPAHATIDTAAATAPVTRKVALTTSVAWPVDVPALAPAGATSPRPVPTPANPAPAQQGVETLEFGELPSVAEAAQPAASPDQIEQATPTARVPIPDRPDQASKSAQIAKGPVPVGAAAPTGGKPDIIAALALSIRAKLTDRTASISAARLPTGTPSAESAKAVAVLDAPNINQTAQADAPGAVQAATHADAAVADQNNAVRVLNATVALPLTASDEAGPAAVPSASQSDDQATIPANPENIDATLQPPSLAGPPGHAISQPAGIAASAAEPGPAAVPPAGRSDDQPTIPANPENIDATPQPPSLAGPPGHAISQPVAIPASAAGPEPVDKSGLIAARVPVERQAQPVAAQPATQRPFIAPPEPRPVAPGTIAPAAIAFAASLGRLDADPRRTPRVTSDAADQPLAIGTISAGALAVTLAAANDAAAPVDTHDRQWIEHIVARIEAVRDAADAGDTRIRLLPEALGKIDVAVRHEGDQVNLRFSAEQPATRQLLIDAQPSLAEFAAARGIRLGQTSVDSGQTGQGQTAQGQMNQSQMGQGQSQQRQPEAPRQPIANHVSVNTAADDSGDAGLSQGWIA